MGQASVPRHVQHGPKDLGRPWKDVGRPELHQDHALPDGRETHVKQDPRGQTVQFHFAPAWRQAFSAFKSKMSPVAGNGSLRKPSLTAALPAWMSNPGSTSTLKSSRFQADCRTLGARSLPVWAASSWFTRSRAFEEFLRIHLVKSAWTFTNRTASPGWSFKKACRPSRTVVR